MERPRLQTELLETDLLDTSTDDQFYTVRRSKIPGGWLVFFERNKQSNVTGSYGLGGMTFVPDPNHEWDGNSI